MRKIMYSLLAIFIATSLFAQSYVERVFILNEGYFDYITDEIITPVTLGSYDPETDVYSVINEIENARFASDIKTDATHYYVAADKYLNKYDIYTDELINSIVVDGIRKIAIDDNYIVVTRGEYLVAFDSYIQVYDKNSLEFVFEIDNATLNYTTEGVVIKDGYAYVAVNNGFDFGAEVGFIAKVDLVYQNLDELINLGTEGINPDNLMLDGDNIYTLNNKDFTGSSISGYSIVSGEVGTSNLMNISSGCGTSAFVNGDIYYQEMFGTTISKYDPVTETILSEDEFGLSFYGLAFDPINNLLYTSETDYFSFGNVHIFDLDGNELSTFNVGISPGNIAFDVRATTGIEINTPLNISLYPNPAVNSINISTNEIIREINIIDINGGNVLQLKNINANDLDIDTKSLIPGNYLISVITDNTTSTRSFSKM